METFLIRALQLILSLSILVVLHEFGHFAFSRLFKVRVEKFYVFFNPKFSLLRAKKINGKWNVKFFAGNIPANERMKLDSNGQPVMDGKNTVMEPVPLSEMSEGDWRRYPETTEWGIGWVPLGGYCKISGMIDESMDKTQMAQPPKPWEYRSRSVWQRLPIIIGGVVVNFILALVIYSAVLFTWGKEYIPLQNAKYGLSYSKSMTDIGFQNGDKILKVDGQEVKTRAEAVEKILIDFAKTVTVERGNQILDIKIPEGLTKKILAAGEANLIDIRYPFVVAEVMKGSPAEKAKLIPGDSVIGVNGKEMNIFQDISAELSASKNSLITVTYVRKGITENTEIQINDDGKLGVYMNPPTNYIQSEKEEYGFFKSIPAGIKMGVETLSSYIKQFKLVFTKEGAKSLGGFDDCISVGYTGIYELSAHSRTGRRLCVIPSVRNDYRTETQ
ncbi:MAG: peptidase [Bacteroidetes bacterium]|nr:peptidase [Bacteroidota bacterium]